MSYVQETDIKAFLSDLTRANKEEELRSIDVNNLDHDRVEYNIILKYIKSIDGEQKDNLYNNAVKFKELPSINDNILRILDYIFLEIPRSKDYERLKNQIVRSDSLLRTLSAKDRENEKIMKEHEVKVSKMQSEFISILSIFSAVVIAFFGGISVLGSSLDNINKTSIYRLLFVIALIGFIMFNIIYMLLYTVAKLTDKNIGIKIDSNECDGCSNKIYFINCLAVKYPIVFIYNISTFIFCFILFIMYIVDKYNCISFIMSLFKILPYNKQLVPIIGLLILLVIICILYIFWQKKLKFVLICNLERE